MDHFLPSGATPVGTPPSPGVVYARLIDSNLCWNKTVVKTGKKDDLILFQFPDTFYLGRSVPGLVFQDVDEYGDFTTEEVQALGLTLGTHVAALAPEVARLAVPDVPYTRLPDNWSCLGRTVKRSGKEGDLVYFLFYDDTYYLFRSVPGTYFQEDGDFTAQEARDLGLIGCEA